MTTFWKASYEFYQEQNDGEVPKKIEVEGEIRNIFWFWCRKCGDSFFTDNEKARENITGIRYLPDGTIDKTFGRLGDIKGRNIFQCRGCF